MFFADSFALAASASLDVQEYASLKPPGQSSLSTKTTAPPALATVWHEAFGASPWGGVR